VSLKPGSVIAGAAGAAYGAAAACPGEIESTVVEA